MDIVSKFIKGVYDYFQSSAVIVPDQVIDVFKKNDFRFVVF